MNFFGVLILALTMSAATVRAQSSPSPAATPTAVSSVATPTVDSTPAPAPSAAVEPPSLIPPNILPPPASFPQMPSAPEIEQLNTLFKQSSLGKKADEHRLHVQMADLKAQIRNDKDLHASLAVANSAPTDLERRHRLRVYYQLYYGKLRNLADTPDLKAYLAAQGAAHELVLLQPKVRHETDEAEAAALNRAKASASVAPAPTPDQARASEALRP